MAGTRFQVGLELLGLPAIRERDIGDDLPRGELRGVVRLSGIVFLKPGAEIMGDAHISLARCAEAFEKVDVDHGSPTSLKLRRASCFALGAKPILRSSKSEAGWRRGWDFDRTLVTN